MLQCEERMYLKIHPVIWAVTKLVGINWRQSHFVHCKTCWTKWHWRRLYSKFLWITPPQPHSVIIFPTYLYPVFFNFGSAWHLACDGVSSLPKHSATNMPHVKYRVLMHKEKTFTAYLVIHKQMLKNW